MFNVGPAELLVIFLIALLVFGPNKLPEVGRQVGKAVREFRRFQESMRDEVRDVFEPVYGGEPPRLPARTDAGLAVFADDHAGEDHAGEDHLGDDHAAEDHAADDHPVSDRGPDDHESAAGDGQRADHEDQTDHEDHAGHPGPDAPSPSGDDGPAGERQAS